MPVEKEIENQMRGEFKTCLTALGAVVSEKDVELLSQVVVQSMSNANRSFHRAEHSLGLLLPGDPILSLAALFHDTVYFQVDEGFPVLADEFLGSVIRAEEPNLFLKEDALTARPELAIVCDIFDVKPGQKLDPLNGLNEFLSAVLAEKYLSPFLPSKILIQIIACIEATIPFRASVGGVDALDTLAVRVAKVSERLKFGFDKKNVSEIVKRAVHLANRDVQNFATDDHARFLATTWLLLPERNESLRGNEFTFGDYRKSVQKMMGFFNFLTEDLVFKQYDGFPEKESFIVQKNAAAKNIAIARLYLNAKLVAIGVLEALATSTGGDLPILKFLGGVKQSDETQRRMEDYLPKFRDPSANDPLILSLLETGRTFETNFDLRNSPLAAFLMRNLSQSQFDDLFESCQHYFAGEIAPIECLTRVPLDLMTPIVNACAKSYPSRGEALSEVLSSLSESQIGR